jgi:glycosyltransferase involved in cell wall biosynthesis
MARLEARASTTHIPGTRVVVDMRPLQEPERTPITAHYLQRLFGAYADAPLEDESFVVICRTLRPDPSVALEERGLPVAARRRVPPTGALFRSAGLTLDSFLLRGAEIGTAGGGGNRPGERTVYHTAGGAVPLASQLPVVATLLDLAPWEMPDVYAASPAARFGHRLRARVLHDAARVIVCSRATAESARRRLHLPQERICVVPLAVDEGYRAAGRDVERSAALRQRLSLPPRYMVFAGRYDARKDLATLLAALRSLRDGGSDSPRGLEAATAAVDPPALVLALQYATDADQVALQRSVERAGVADLVRVLPSIAPDERAALVAGGQAFVYPSLSEGTGLSVLEALSIGIPVIASRAGAPPEFVGSAGIVVEPGDPRRLAAAIAALWAGGSLAEQLQRAARARAQAWSRSWSDVASETRAVYAAAAASGPV